MQIRANRLLYRRQPHRASSKKAKFCASPFVRSGVYSGVRYAISCAFALLLLSCGDSLNTSVSAFLYTEHPEEEAFLRDYNTIYPGAGLELSTMADKAAYMTHLSSLQSSDQMPDILSTWTGREGRLLGDAGELADLRPLVDFSILNPNILTNMDRLDPIWTIPIRYNFTNNILINRNIINQLGVNLASQSIDTIEDLRNLLDLANNRGITPLLIASFQTSSLGDLFMSNAISWTDRFWYRDLVRGIVGFRDPLFLNALSSFTSNFQSSLLAPNLFDMTPSQARADFASGRALCIIGETEQLLPLMVEGNGNFKWLPFPNADRRTHKTEYGAALGPMLGVSVAQHVNSYTPLYREHVQSVLNYYTGLYSYNQRIREWGIIAPLQTFSLRPEQPAYISETMEYLKSLNYTYEPPSEFLPPGVNQVFNEGLLALLQNRINADQLIDNLTAALSTSK